MCPKCAGNGRYYTEEQTGVWRIHPCLCSHSMPVRQAKEQKFQEFLNRWEVAYEEYYGRKREQGTSREVLSTT